MSARKPSLRLILAASLGIACIIWVMSLRHIIRISPAASTEDILARRLRETRWIAYSPTHYDPRSKPPVLPSEESIRADLKVLRKAGFNGLVTYGFDVPAIPRVAEEVGFRWLLLGVWNPNDQQELRRAKEAARSPHVLGIIVGNEGLTFGRYTQEQLRIAMQKLRMDTGKPVSTTEVIEQYFSNPALAHWSDFLAVNAHPFFHGRMKPGPAAEWTVKAYEKLAEHYPGKPIIFKEVGLPTAGMPGLSEQNQADYYKTLAKSDVQFCYFEAFDSPWKKGSLIEPHWGIFHADRTPKLAARDMRRDRPWTFELVH